MPLIWQRENCPLGEVLAVSSFFLWNIVHFEKRSEQIEISAGTLKTNNAKNNEKRDDQHPNGKVVERLLLFC